MVFMPLTDGIHVSFQRICDKVKDELVPSVHYICKYVHFLAYWTFTYINMYILIVSIQNYLGRYFR